EPEPRATAKSECLEALTEADRVARPPRPLRRLCRSGRHDVSRERGRGQRFAAGQLKGQFGSVGASNRASEIQVHEALRLTHAFAGGELKRLAERGGFEPWGDVPLDTRSEL